MEVREVTPGDLGEYGQVPIRFWVHERWTPAGFVPVAVPWEKEYDAPGNCPEDWSLQFDLTNWGFFTVQDDERVVAGAAVCRDAPGVELLEGRSDLAFLWDVRVAPEVRGSGIGRRLWQQCEAWCRACEVRELRVETQDINAPACRFYAHMGCELLSVTPGAYDQLPDEIQLIWGKRLDL